MGLIPEDKIGEVRDRTDIAQVVGEHVSLRRAGTSLKGLCPFHSEKSPSFNVNPQRQFFHCFGCGKSGDVFTFLMEIEGKSFIEVARDLARRAGVDLPEPQQSERERARQKEAESERARLVRLHDLVAGFYEEQLASTAGSAARAYLERRGLSLETRARFRVGYAPAGWEALVSYLAERRVPAELAERAGLIRRRDRAPANLPAGAPPSTRTHFDVFVDRVVYPLSSAMGEPIGFGGRVLDGAGPDQPKYKNSPETLIYKKGENLFGLHLARNSIRKGGRALVVEGNFDVMTLHDHGIDYTVAPQGTAMTEAQVRLVSRFARELVLMLDADPAGRAATLKLVKLCVDAELPARVAQLRSRDGKKVDPDELARTDLPRLQGLIDHAIDAVEFFFDQVATSAPPTIPGRVAAIEECVPVLRAVRDPLARDLYLDRLAQLLRVEPALVRRTVRAAAPSQVPSTRHSLGTYAPAGTSEGPRGPAIAPPGPDSSPARALSDSSTAGGEGPLPSAAAPPKPRKLSLRVAKLLALLAQHGKLLPAMPRAALEAIVDDEERALLLAVVDRGSFDSAAVLELAPPSLRASVAQALLSEEDFSIGDASPTKILDDIASSLLRPRERQRLEEERRVALGRNDFGRVRELTAQILRLTTAAAQRLDKEA
jgi:DNA primase